MLCKNGPAPKFRTFVTNMSNENSNIKALILHPSKVNENNNNSQISEMSENSFSIVPRKSLSWIMKMTKIEDNKLFLYKTAFSTESLLAAYYQIKSKPGNLTAGLNSETLDNINLRWFEITSIKLLNGSFIYPKVRRVYIPKVGSHEKRLLTFTSPRIKIIEKSILNALEPMFEGKFKWKNINKETYDSIFGSNSKETIVVKNNTGFFMKEWEVFPVFSRFSFGFRPHLSAHNALHVIKSWPTNLNWFVKFDIKKAFDNVNINRLKNIFLKYCPDNRVWGELNKLIKTKVINLEATTHDNLGISHGSVLSPFLFNIYMNELDRHIEKLQSEIKTTESNHKVNKGVKNKYEAFARKFCTKRGLASTLAEMGSPEMVLSLYKKERTAFYKEHGTSDGENLFLRRLVYVRYADDFLIGITGPRSFARKISVGIENFIKSNLQLPVHDFIFTSRDGGAVKFIGFNIYLSSIRKKAKVKSTKIKSIVKYKMRSIARLKGSDARISQAYFNSIKHGFLNYFTKLYEELKLNKNKKTDSAFIENFVNKNLEEKLSKKFQPGGNKLSTNTALRRFSQHFKDLFSKNINISLKVWNNNFKDLELFKQNFILTRDLVELIKTRDEFLTKLKIIENAVVDEVQETARQEAYSVYEMKQSLKFFHNSAFSKINKEDFARTAANLSLRTLNITRARRISIRFDIKSFYEKLARSGFYASKKNFALSVPKLIFLNDYEIIAFYNALIRGYLNWFRCSDNFTKAKNIIWTLRISCLKTLARKHKKNITWALNVFDVDVKCQSPSGVVFSLPTTQYITNLEKKFMLKDSSFKRPDVEELLKKYSFRLHRSQYLFSQCSVLDCSNTDIEIHHIKKLNRKINNNGKITIMTTNNKRVSGLSAIMSVISRKQIPLCALHHLEFELGNFYTLDTEFFKKYFGINCSGLDFREIFYGK